MFMDYNDEVDEIVPSDGGRLYSHCNLDINLELTPARHQLAECVRTPYEY